MDPNNCHGGASAPTSSKGRTTNQGVENDLHTLPSSSIPPSSTTLNVSSNINTIQGKPPQHTALQQEEIPVNREISFLHQQRPPNRRVKRAVLPINGDFDSLPLSSRDGNSKADRQKRNPRQYYRRFWRQHQQQQQMKQQNEQQSSTTPTQEIRHPLESTSATSVLWLCLYLVVNLGREYKTIKELQLQTLKRDNERLNQELEELRHKHSAVKRRFHMHLQGTPLKPQWEPSPRTSKVSTTSKRRGRQSAPFENHDSNLAKEVAARDMVPMEPATVGGTTSSPASSSISSLSRTQDQGDYTSGQVHHQPPTESHPSPPEDMPNHPEQVDIPLTPSTKSVNNTTAGINNSSGVSPSLESNGESIERTDTENRFYVGATPTKQAKPVGPETESSRLVMCTTTIPSWSRESDETTLS